MKGNTSCIFDTETGGLEPEHPTIQIAALCIDNETFEEVDSVNFNIEFDEALCDPEALKMNAYDPDAWKLTSSTLPFVQDRLDRFFRSHADYKLISKKGDPYDSVRLIAHNAPFDVPRLREMWGSKYTPFCWWYPLDTLQLALWTFRTVTDPEKRPKNLQLPTLCEFYGIESIGAHDALADCRLVAALLPHLTVGGTVIV
jgi:DNA polymerase III epsilon subunit-like protein